MNLYRPALLILSVCVNVAMAQAAKPNEEPLDSLSYPELMVAPRASERLRLEAAKEGRQHWKNLLPFEVSALATLAAGLQGNGSYDQSGGINEKTENTQASQAAMLIGGGWLITSFAITSMYDPYLKGYAAISKLPSGTQREQLTRERLAEESLHAPGDLAWRLRILSSASNFLAAGYLGLHTDGDARITAGVAALLAFTPWVFAPSWLEVSEQHRLYKKKIYGPIASLSWLAPGAGSNLIPVPALAWSF